MLILASESPRRSELLTSAGIPFVRRAPTPIDEAPLPDENPTQYVMRLAREKSLRVEPREGEIVLGADTAVVVEDQILGKPADDDDARRMLGLLSGRTHEVITGICLVTRTATLVDAASTTVRFGSLSQGEIESYVASREPLDKAGAYAIQGLASKFVERIDGCYSNVVGLPVSLLYRHLRALCYM